MFSPDGTRYEMTLQGTPVGTSPRPINTYYVSRIVDRNGNWMNLTYALMASGGAAVSGITTSDGRTVTFNYIEMAGLSHVLKSVVEGTPLSPGRTWNYLQVPTPNTLGATNLMEVQRPDGASWKHEYNNGGSTSPGAYSLRRITYPAGGSSITPTILCFSPKTFLFRVTRSSGKSWPTRAEHGLGITRPPVSRLWPMQMEIFPIASRRVRNSQPSQPSQTKPG